MGLVKSIAAISVEFFCKRPVTWGLGAA